MYGFIGRRSAAGILSVVAIAVAVAGCESNAASRSAPAVGVPESVPQVRTTGDGTFIRYRLDAARNRIWVLAADGVALYEASTGEDIAQIPLPGWIRAGGKYSCAPDLALGPRGEVVISSNVVPTLWRVDPVTLVVSKHDLVVDEDKGRDIGFTALAFSAQQGAYFAVSAAHGSLWRVDPQFGRAQSIPLSAPLPTSCTQAISPHDPDRRAIRAVGICVQGEEGGWTVAFAPDQRFGYLRAGQCKA